MKRFVQMKSVNGMYYLYDAVEGKLLAMKFTGLHEGIKEEGPFLVSCADFTDQFGRKLDVDFIAVRGKDGYVTTEAIVHKVGQAKRVYSLKLEPVE